MPKRFKPDHAYIKRSLELMQLLKGAQTEEDYQTYLKELDALTDATDAKRFPRHRTRTLEDSRKGQAVDDHSGLMRDDKWREK